MVNIGGQEELFKVIGRELNRRIEFKIIGELYQQVIKKE